VREREGGRKEREFGAPGVGPTGVGGLDREEGKADTSLKTSTTKIVDNDRPGEEEKRYFSRTNRIKW